MNTLRNFFREEEGQDLVEYTLLLAFVALAAAAILGTASQSIHGIWVNAQQQLNNANAQSSS